MKTKTIVILAVTITLFSFILPNKKEDFRPPGTVKIGENIFMDETEITNISWQEYMYWTERIYGKTSEKYLATLPDTNVWQEPYRTHYFKNSAYREYPVVGVSWQQAKDYCDWRSDRVMEQLMVNKARNPKTIIPSKLTYRLPTQQEWTRIAGAGYSEKTQSKLDKKYASSSKSNYKSEDSAETQNTTSPVYQYWPNKYGTYNMLGNVAEMTSQEGVAKGGSWMQKENEVTVSKEFKYNEASNWVGFRCICEVTF